MKQKLRKFWYEWGFSKEELSWIIIIPPLFLLPYFLFWFISTVL